MPDLQRIFPDYNALNHQLQDHLFLCRTGGPQPPHHLRTKRLDIAQHLLTLRRFL